MSPKLKDLPPPYCGGIVGIVLPLRVTKLNSGPKPRTLTVVPSSLLLSVVTPTILDKASARFPSGNLPRSSAVIASTIPTFFLLISIASLRLDLIPVVTTSSISSSTASCAYIDVVNGKSTISDNKYLFTVFPFLMYIKVYVCI